MPRKSSVVLVPPVVVPWRLVCYFIGPAAWKKDFWSPIFTFVFHSKFSIWKLLSSLNSLCKNSSLGVGGDPSWIPATERTRTPSTIVREPTEDMCLSSPGNSEKKRRKAPEELLRREAAVRMMMVRIDAEQGTRGVEKVGNHPCRLTKWGTKYYCFCPTPRAILFSK